MNYRDASKDAAAMIRRALTYAGEKMKGADALELLKQNNEAALGYFRYWLAREVASYLGKESDLVEEAFICAECPDEQPITTSPVTLIVRAKKKTAALESAAEGLQEDLLGEYRKLLSAESLAVFLDICLVDHDDIACRKGAAALIGSLYTPALQVWKR